MFWLWITQKELINHKNQIKNMYKYNWEPNLWLISITKMVSYYKKYYENNFFMNINLSVNPTHEAWVGLIEQIFQNIYSLWWWHYIVLQKYFCWREKNEIIIIILFLYELHINLQYKISAFLKTVHWIHHYTSTLAIFSTLTN